MSTFRYIYDNWDSIGPEIRTHLEIVAACMVIAVVAGLVLGVASAHDDRVAGAALAVTSLLITVPSYALFGLLTIWFGLGNEPVIVGLALYALLPIVRNTNAGLRAVRPEVTEAAIGMGMRPRQVLLRVELPLALPVILGGIRQATVMVVAIASVGATVGADDLGRPILAAVGRTQGSYERLLAGVLPIAAIGILVDATLASAQFLLGRDRIRTAPT